MHIKRLKDRQNKTYEFIVYDLSKEKKKQQENVLQISNVKTWLFKYFFFAKEDIIHSHNTNWYFNIMIALMGLFRKKIVITLHGSSLKDFLINKKWYIIFLLRFVFRFVLYFIVVNEHLKKTLLSLGIKNKNIKILSAFLFPVINNKETLEISTNVKDFIKKHTPIISANAYKIVFYNNEDLYGIDMCIELCFRLKKNFNNIGFIFCLPNIENYKYFDYLKEELKRKGIEKNFIFILEQKEFYPILINSDLFVRPTNIDGFGVSISESIFLNVPVVASNVCLRERGTIIFRNRDNDDFHLKTKEVLDNYKEYKRKVEHINLKDNFEQLLNIYGEI